MLLFFGEGFYVIDTLDRSTANLTKRKVMAGQWKNHQDADFMESDKAKIMLMFPISTTNEVNW